MRGRKWPTEAERVAAARESRRKYDQTDKGRAKYARYRRTSGYAAAQSRHATKVDKVAVAVQWAIDNPERAKANKRRSWLGKYGLTPDEYRDMEVGQAGRCLLCLRVPGRALHVDHDHATGAVRGLLCGLCNRMLGHARDDTRTLLRAAAYVERSQ